MVQRFHHEAVTAILALGPQQLTKIEIIVLKALLTASHDDIYWDSLNRLDAVVDDLPIILRNIAHKARHAGLEPMLTALKEKPSHEPVEPPAVLEVSA